MVYSVQDGFTRLKSNLEITNLQGSVVSTRQQTIRRTVSNGLNVYDDFLTGSYARSTMISPLSEADIDIFVCLDASYFHRFNNASGGPAGLLNLVRQTIRKTYTSTPDISRNGQAVTIRFSDFVVDVVVGFVRQGGGYIIANSVNNFWLSTDPKKHVEQFSAANARHNGDLVPLIKMIKSWNKAHGSFFRSFHLECLALQSLSNVTITDFQSGLRYFFQQAMSQVRLPCYDPAGYGDNIGRYITAANVDEAARKMQAAFNTARTAEQYSQRGQVQQAIQIWRHLLPNHFPAYG